MTRRLGCSRLTWIAIGLFLTSLWWLPRLCLFALERALGLPPLDADLSLATILYVITAVFGIGYAYWDESGHRDRINAQNARELNALRQLQYEQQTLGDETESRVGNILLEHARELDPDATLLTGAIMRYPQIRSGKMSRFEVDCMLLTRFGIILVEVKNWKDPVSITQDGWKIHRPDGAEDIKSPLQQGAPKQRVIREVVEECAGGVSSLRVESIVVMCHRDARFPMDAPREILYLNDLRYYLRLAYQRVARAGLLPSEQIDRAKTAIAGLHDAAPDAKHRFLLELAETTGGAQEYLAYEKRRQEVLQRPPATMQPLWFNVRAYAPAVIALMLMAAVQDYKRGPILPQFQKPAVKELPAKAAQQSKAAQDSTRPRRTPPAEKK